MALAIAECLDTETETEAKGVSTLSLAERGGDAATNYPSVHVSCMAVRPHREVVRWWGARSSRPSTGLILL